MSPYVVSVPVPVIAAPGFPTMGVPSELFGPMVLASYQTINVSVPCDSDNVETKSFASSGTTRIVCEAKGARSKSVVDVVAKHAGNCRTSVSVPSGHSVGAFVGERVGEFVGESVGAGEGPVVGLVVG